MYGFNDKFCFELRKIYNKNVGNKNQDVNPQLPSIDTPLINENIIGATGKTIAIKNKK